ncbi:MAG: acyl-CoA dehydrogenase [Caulobacteraceae bacterium]|nr:acyl-CoA dehydrogenase [Caulobacteraceae bacterium]
MMVVDEESRLIRETVRRFVERELMPLEAHVAKQQVAGDDGSALTNAQYKHLRVVSKELGLWGLDAPEALGGFDLPAVAMAGVAQELGRTITPFVLPPDTPNLKMLDAVGTPEQRERHLKPYIEGRTVSCMAISEPGAGGDPAGIRTRAERTADGWALNGRKIWITNAEKSDFMIAMARVGEGKRQEGVTAFIVEQGTPGLIIERSIPMVGDTLTYELVFDNCRLPEGAVLGEIGAGYAPMQLRLISRRMEMASTCVGMTERALDILCEHARQRVTFGAPLADRQAIQWWVADLATRLHAARLMIHDAAEKLDRGEDIRHEASMVKVYATELAYDACDHAMQTLGALGMTKESPLFHMWGRARIMRIYEGPSEVHRQAVARRVLGGRR